MAKHNKHLPIPPEVSDWLEVVPVTPPINSGLIWKKPKYKAYKGKNAGFISSYKNDVVGYWQIKLIDKVYNVARVIYFIEHKIDPSELTVDHKDRNTLNNNISNLRLLSKQQQKINQNKYKNNKSGARGVIWHTRDNKWQAQIRFNGKLHSLGYFICKLEAAIAYNEAAKKLYTTMASDALNDLNRLTCNCSRCLR